MAVFFDVEKADDMLWKEGLLIKMHLLGVRGKMSNWIMDFLNMKKKKKMSTTVG